MSQSELPARLSGVLHDIASEITEAVRTLIDRKLVCQKGELRQTTIDALASELPNPAVVVRGTSTVRFVVNAPTAVTLAACMRMDSTQALEEERAEGTLKQEDLEAFGDIATVFCSGAESALHRVLPDQELRLESYRAFETDSKWGEHLGSGSLVWYRFPLAIDEFPDSSIHIILDAETAELWNGESLDSLEVIPQAPIRGKLAAYIVDPRLLEVVKRTCRRVGLELDRYPTSAIPNPAAHKGQLVLMDVPTGEERRFGWCKRLARHPGGIKTILIIHHPSRARVIEGFRSLAHTILGWPVTEAQLSAKIDAMLDDSPEPSEVEG